jgi:hypothetical protein
MIGMRAIPLLAALLAASATAQQLAYQVSDQVVEPGGLVTLTLDLQGVPAGLRGFTLALEYENDLLDIFSINQGSLLLAHNPSFLYWNDELVNGRTRVLVDYAILGATAGFGGDGDLLHLSFEGVGCGIQNLVVESAEFRDLSNDPVPVGLGAGVEHQVCQVPPLSIRHLPGGDKELSWGRVLNATYFTVLRSPEMIGPWLPVHQTSDTLWVDPGVASWPRALYRLTVEHP